MVTVRRFAVEGFEVVELANDILRIGITPELGARIVDLVHLRTGRQWMWKSGRNPQHFRASLGTAFDRGPLFGADECLPTIAPCHWRGRELPDHGEAWTEPWELDEAALAQGGRLTTKLRLPISPLLIERTLCLDGDCLRFNYRLENRSEDPQEYLWALHPMMNIEPGDRIVLPDGCRHVQTEVCLGDCPLGNRGDVWNWPHPTDGIDLANLDLGGRRRAVKLYTEPLVEGSAAIVNDVTGERLSFSFDPAKLNTLGIWINRGGFQQAHHVALEPTNAAPDSLAMAIDDWKRFGLLAPGETQCWDLNLQWSVAQRT